MTPQLEAARRQLHRFEAAAIRDGAQDIPAVNRFRAALAIRVLALEARRKREAVGGKTR